MGDASGTSLAAVDPLHEHAVRLLAESSEEWTDAPLDGPVAQNGARSALLRCGALEQHAEFVATVEGSADTLSIALRCEGEVDRAWLADTLLSHAPASWRGNGWRRLWGDTPRATIRPVGLKTRLTVEGERIRRSAADGEFSVVIAFVFGIGPIPSPASRRRQPTPRIVSCSTSTFAGDQRGEGFAGQSPPVVAAAQANASIGDVNIVNQVDTTPIADAIREALARGSSTDGDDDPPENDTRDAWMYERQCAGEKRAVIRYKLKSEYPNWEQLETDQAVTNAVKRYCERHKRPRPEEVRKG